ncbi:hypothetical protein FRC17_003730 [Serendipita sp. 399]|nr:hypothetical protein FRC17_003730 [Serendipita sp. 399]
MPKLRVLAGPSANELTPISDIVNTFGTHRIVSDRFDGEICVHIKGFVDEDGKRRDSAYFDPVPSTFPTPNGSYESISGHGHSSGSSSSTTSISTSSNRSGSGGKVAEQRKGVTWSIQVRGRFLVDGLTMDDVLFGNTFDRPLRLPWGSGAALKFMSYIDPTLEHALNSERPWALSPLVSTMPYFAISHANGPTREFANSHGSYVEDDTRQLRQEGVPRLKSSAARRQYFANPAKRRETPIKVDDTITTDFCYGFLSFPEIRLNLPGGISFDLMNYWDGQPVRFVCCERRKGDKGSGGTLKGPGDPFWVVVFQAVLDGEEATPVPGELDPTQYADVSQDVD